MGDIYHLCRVFYFDLAGMLQLYPPNLTAARAPALQQAHDSHTEWATWNVAECRRL
jgi:hypothetical protein